MNTFHGVRETCSSLISPSRSRSDTPDDMSQNDPSPSIDDPLLSVEQAAQRLGVCRSFLDKRRVYGGGPQYLRLSTRKIAYRTTALDAWLADRAQHSTSEDARA